MWRTMNDKRWRWSRVNANGLSARHFPPHQIECVCVCVRCCGGWMGALPTESCSVFGVFNTQFGKWLCAVYWHLKMEQTNAVVIVVTHIDIFRTSVSAYLLRAPTNKNCFDVIDWERRALVCVCVCVRRRVPTVQQNNMNNTQGINVSDFIVVRLGDWWRWHGICEPVEVANGWYWFWFLLEKLTNISHTTCAHN